MKKLFLISFMKQIVIALVMCVVGAVSAVAEIVTTFWDGPMLFQVLSEEEGTAALIAPTVESMDAEYLQGMTKITVPSTATDATTGLTYQITMVRGDVFTEKRDMVEEVIVPDGVKEVYGFYNLTNLKSLILPNSVERIGGFTTLTNLKEFVFPENLKEIVRMSFTLNALESIILPKGLTSIGYYTFTGSHETTTLKIPGVVGLDDYALSGLSKLKKLVLPPCLKWVNWQVFYGNMEEIWFESDGTNAECFLHFNSFICRPKVVYCARPVPPTIEYYDLFITDGGEDPDKISYKVIFGGFGHMKNVKLYVPVGYGDVYRQHRFWGAMQVQEFDFEAGVVVPEADAAPGADTCLYDLQGRVVAESATPSPGIYVSSGRKHLVR